MRSTSVKKLLFIAFSAVGMLPLLLFTGIFWSVLRRHLDEDLNHTSLTVLRAVSAQTTSLVQEGHRRLLPALLMMAGDSTDPAFLRSVLRAGLTPRSEMLRMAFLDSQDRVQGIYPDALDAMESDMTVGAAYALHAPRVQGDIAVSLPFVYGKRLDTALEVSYSIKGRTVLSHMDLTGISSKLVLLSLSPRDRIVVADASGRYILCSDPSRVGRGERLRPESLEPGPRKTETDEGLYYTSSLPIPGSDWKAVYLRSYEEANAAISTYLRLVLGLAALGLILSEAFAIAAWKTISEPLTLLTSRIRAIAEGQYSERVAGRFFEEFDGIASAFNVMAESIERRDREKTQMIQEIYHRVKNNQQIVVSLLRMQADAEESPDARAALRVAQDRMFAMSLAHDLVYHMADLSSVDMKEFTERLIANFTLGYGEQARSVEMTMEPVRLDLERAVPLSLILNELISAVIHKPPGSRDDEPIRIEASAGPGEDGRRTVLFSIYAPEAPRENGIREKSQGWGETLATALASQLDGDFSWFFTEPGGGRKAYLRFPVYGEES